VIFMLLIGVVAIYRSMPLNELIKVLGVFGVSGLRLMPASTSLITSINSLRSSRHVLELFADDFRQISRQAVTEKDSDNAGAGAENFSELCFSKVSYAYPGTEKPVIKNLDFRLKRGQAMGIIGRTGSGKSTLADMLLGFLKPQRGVITVNGKDIHGDDAAWQQRLAYIPQSI